MLVMDSSYRLVKLCLVGAFVSLGAMCIACFILRPELFNHPHWGLSYYAMLWPTSIPYTLGLAGGTACLTAIAHRLRIYGGTMRTIRLFFTLIGNLLLGILLTPLSLHSIVFWAHMAVSFGMLLVQIALLLWALQQADITTADRVLVAISCIATIHLVLSNEATALLGWYVLGQIGALGAGLALLGRITLRRMASLSAR